MWWCKNEVNLSCYYYSVPLSIINEQRVVPFSYQAILKYNDKFWDSLWLIKTTLVVRYSTFELNVSMTLASGPLPQSHLSILSPLPTLPRFMNKLSRVFKLSSYICSSHRTVSTLFRFWATLLRLNFPLYHLSLISMVAITQVTMDVILTSMDYTGNFVNFKSNLIWYWLL